MSVTAHLRKRPPFCSAADFIAAVQARGSDATTARDAAHEALHALDGDVPEGRWDRETIHAAMMAMRRADGAASEVLARAVEQLVCADLGEGCDTIEKCAFNACREALHYGVAFPGVEWFANAVRTVMATSHARSKADAVLALARAKEPARRRKSDAPKVEVAQ